jgi:VIT1/CCC1 family predicted Fe2+/Mn2+ transporter
VFGAIESHLGSRQVSRVTYGAIIGLALIVALESHPPGPGVVAGTLLGTAIAVGLAELYSDVLGTEIRERRHVHSVELRHIESEAVAVAFGVAFPVVFFLLAAAGAIEGDSAFTISKWSGLGLIGVYGYWAARLAGETRTLALLRALAAALIAAFVIALKAVLH